MKIGVLTTETLHHTFFVKELAKTYPNLFVCLEKISLKAPFSTEHSFESLRENHEAKIFFEGENIKIEGLAPTKKYDSLNSKEAVADIQMANLDIAIDFGTRKLNVEIIETLPGRLINLHGGNPEEYRGLDSHLWAIYHKDFKNLVTTLHFLDSELDTGNIIREDAVVIRRNMKIHELREANTRTCLRITLDALDEFSKKNEFLGRPQRKKGRYYSFMPTDLKEICRKEFERYTGGLS